MGLKCFTVMKTVWLDTMDHGYVDVTGKPRLASAHPKINLSV